MNLDKQVAIVTGAASGIGLATAETLARAGAHVVVADIARGKGEKAAQSIRDQGSQAEFFYLDVTDSDSIESFKHEVLAWRSHVDIVANVAGWGKIQPFVENTPEFWRHVIDLNLMGPIAITRAFLEGMMEQNYGKVIVVASDAGRVGSLGETVYSAAKGGAIAFTKSLAREMARYHINVNSVCPGPTDTPLLAAVPEKHQQAFIRATPMRRLGKPGEIADAVLFLVSARADFITGQVLSVNGGLVIPG
ncbi:MAG: SDR family NAD(P)-dependent oxidoreductase [Gammaproteobacteria bacterium]